MRVSVIAYDNDERVLPYWPIYYNFKQLW